MTRAIRETLSQPSPCAAPAPGHAIVSLQAFAQWNPNPVMAFSGEGRLVYCNDAALTMAKSLGKSGAEAMLPPETIPTVQGCLLNGHAHHRLETSSNGRSFSWSFFPIRPDQVVYCYVEDITDRRKLEGQLRHSQKLESVGRLAAGVAHDFNNILTVIRGHAGLLRAWPHLSTEMEESLQQVSRAAERGAMLAGQLLTFSRKSNMDPKRLDLNEALTNISMMLQRTLGEDISFQFSYAPNLPLVCADRAMLEQLVMNMAVNARDAMPNGGQLVITTSVASIDSAYVQRHPDAREGQFVCLTMIDTGCGMDSATLARLFEPFFTTKNPNQFAGLGLATAYGIVKQHQGWIEVQSQVGQGSTFRVYLPPLEPQEKKSHAATPAPSVAGGKETVLVVEDEPPVRWIVRNVLKRHGYEVLEAGNGVEALAVWHQRQEDIALLLTDMVMPVGLSGQELAEKFRAQKPNLKVIFTSGYTVEVAGNNLNLMDGLDFLQKPFDADRLASAVRKCLDS